MSGASAPLRLIEIPLEDGRWPAFVAGCPAATIFHSPAWVRTVSEPYRFRGFALGALDAAGVLRAFVPLVEVDLPLRSRRWVSLPFTDVCPPLLDSTVDEAALLGLLDDARADAGVSSIEVHAPIDGASLGQRGVEHVLALGQDPEELRRGFKKQVWQKVRQAERQGLRVREATRREDFLDTYYALHLATRRRQGVPCQPRRFFERLWEYLLEPGNGLLLLAEHEGTAAGGAVFLAGSSTLVYKYSASLPRFWSLRPNNLLLWTVMQWGITHGYDRLHFGRSDLENQGLRAFKSGWGAGETPLFYGTVGRVPRGSREHELDVSRAAERVIRSSPPFVCRLLGEVFYRFAA